VHLGAIEIPPLGGSAVARLTALRMLPFGRGWREAPAVLPRGGYQGYVGVW